HWTFNLCGPVDLTPVSCQSSNETRFNPADHRQLCVHRSIFSGWNSTAFETLSTVASSTDDAPNSGSEVGTTGSSTVVACYELRTPIGNRCHDDFQSSDSRSDSCLCSLR